MRSFALVVCLSLVSLVVASPAMAATTHAFEARVDEGFGRATAHPCPTTELFSFCGTGTITGFGDATTVTEVVSFENFDPATSCADVTLRRTMTLENGSALVLMETGTICFPGKSTLAPGAAKSFGNPFNIEAAFTIVTGIGVFTGAQGSGTDVIKAAGDTGHSRLSGLITLP
jgi:energy-converting hydrogenase Eha subunit H